MTKINIYLVRHGQTYYNIYNKLQGWSNSPLTDQGYQDAEKAGQRLKDVHFDAAFCSDLTRAVETAQTILDENKADSVKEPTTAPYFREEFYGSYEGPIWTKLGITPGLPRVKDLQRHRHQVQHRHRQGLVKRRRSLPRRRKQHRVLETDERRLSDHSGRGAAGRGQRFVGFPRQHLPVLD